MARPHAQQSTAIDRLCERRETEKDVAPEARSPRVREAGECSPCERGQFVEGRARQAPGPGKRRHGGFGRAERANRAVHQDFGNVEEAEYLQTGRHHFGFTVIGRNHEGAACINGVEEALLVTALGGNRTRTGEAHHVRGRSSLGTHTRYSHWL